VRGGGSDESLQCAVWPDCSCEEAAHDVCGMKSRSVVRCEYTTMRQLESCDTWKRCEAFSIATAISYYSGYVYSSGSVVDIA